MKKTRSERLAAGTFVLLMTGACSSLMAQPAGSDAASAGFQANRLSVGPYLGFTDDDDTEFTYGAEIEFETTEPWSAGVILEQTTNMYAERDLTVLMGTANYRPFTDRRLKLTGGLGVGFNEDASDDTVLRAGVGYDLFFETPWVVTPRIAVDFSDGRERLIYGVTGFYHF